MELHLWSCEPFQPEQRGRLVFDFDPAPDVAFDEVIVAARDVRDRLEALGLVSFCKTTGGEGLHVVTPVKAYGVDWAAAKAFAREVCKRMAADAPDRYLITMAKAAREGRIFLDYLGNDRMATAVAPFSPRGRPGAPVSTPLTWSQVKAGLDPARFTVRSVPGLLKGLKAWRDYDEGERTLAEAIGCGEGSKVRAVRPIHGQKNGNPLKSPSNLYESDSQMVNYPLRPLRSDTNLRR